MTKQKRPWLQRCETDAKLLERSGLDELTLRRLRKALHQEWAQSHRLEREVLSRNGTAPRFAFLVMVMSQQFSSEQYGRVLQNLLDHTQHDVDEMGIGQYPIGPFETRVMSALFGIRVDFLLLGTDPLPDRIGADIDAWPMSQTR